MRTDEVTFVLGGVRLAGTIFLPDSEGPYPAVVIVHGSGAVDRYGAEGTLRPVIHHFAASGYAVLAYDKPGVGNSDGDWLRQTFSDRASETLTAVRILADRPDIDANRVGLWGISQGGWTAPMTAVLAPGEIGFAILVSASAITPCQQYLHQLDVELNRDGFTATQIAQAKNLTKQRTAALAGGVPGSEILAAEPPSLAAEPWYRYCATDAEELDFVRPIWQFDVSPFLRRVSCPLLALWGAQDVHMPAQRCAAAFAVDLAEAGHQDFRLQVFPHANHRLRDTRAGAAPDALAAGYLDDMTRWLSHRVGSARAAAVPPA
ncbi:alpha/beta hydrolase family protein [Streptomyces sp. NPDC090029]|uniref:alpha/beta hydrolase family protein n=1 Tax=Streptomyces sp. NPDC090029 TaxID=3365924 RepID=UPI0038144521